MTAKPRRRPDGTAEAHRVRKVAQPTTSSLADSVYSQLLQAINDGRFRPGDRVMERSVAEWLEVSRTPVREALRRLESEDVLARGTQGLVVVDIGDQELLELYDLREKLEEMAAALAARCATPSDRKRLARVLADEAASDPRDAAAQASINREFHRVLAAAAHNRYLVKTLNGLQDAFLRLRSTVFSIPGRPEATLAEHRAIVRAVEQQDPTAAARAARRHICASRRTRLALQRQAERAGRQVRGQPSRIALRHPQ